MKRTAIAIVIILMAFAITARADGPHVTSIPALDAVLNTSPDAWQKMWLKDSNGVAKLMLNNVTGDIYSSGTAHFTTVQWATDTYSIGSFYASGSYFASGGVNVSGAVLGASATFTGGVSIGGNLNTTGDSHSGNLYTGNATATGNIDATNLYATDIHGTYLYGTGATLSQTVGVGGNVNITGDAHAAHFIGDGSAITGVASATLLQVLRAGRFASLSMAIGPPTIPSDYFTLKLDTVSNRNDYGLFINGDAGTGTTHMLEIENIPPKGQGIGVQGNSTDYSVKISGGTSVGGHFPLHGLLVTDGHEATSHAWMQEGIRVDSAWAHSKPFAIYHIPLASDSVIMSDGIYSAYIGQTWTPYFNDSYESFSTNVLKFAASALRVNVGADYSQATQTPLLSFTSRGLDIYATATTAPAAYIESHNGVGLDVNNYAATATARFSSSGTLKAEIDAAGNVWASGTISAGGFVYPLMLSGAVGNVGPGVATAVSLSTAFPNALTSVSVTPHCEGNPCVGTVPYCWVTATSTAAFSMMCSATNTVMWTAFGR